MSPGRQAVRVFAEWLDDPTECRFAFDLILDSRTLRIVGSWAIFGATDLDRPDRRAFLLDASGSLDFGSPERAWRTDLREQRIEVAGRFSVWWTSTEWGAYEIVKVAALGSKSLGQQT